MNAALFVKQLMINFGKLSRQEWNKNNYHPLINLNHIYMHPTMILDSINRINKKINSLELKQKIPINRKVTELSNNKVARLLIYQY